MQLHPITQVQRQLPFQSGNATKQSYKRCSFQLLTNLCAMLVLLSFCLFVVCFLSVPFYFICCFTLYRDCCCSWLGYTVGFVVISTKIQNNSAPNMFGIYSSTDGRTHILTDGHINNCLLWFKANWPNYLMRNLKKKRPVTYAGAFQWAPYPKSCL